MSCECGSAIFFFFLLYCPHPKVVHRLIVPDFKKPNVALSAWAAGWWPNGGKLKPSPVTLGVFFLCSFERRVCSSTLFSTRSSGRGRPLCCFLFPDNAPGNYVCHTLFFLLQAWALDLVTSIVGQFALIRLPQWSPCYWSGSKMKIV